MAKISRDDFSRKYVEKFKTEDDGIEFLEDLSDSFTDKEVVEKSLYDDVASKYEDLKEKYKSRFFDTDEKVEPPKEKDEELEEKQVIDIKSIFNR